MIGAFLVHRKRGEPDGKRKIRVLADAGRLAEN